MFEKLLQKLINDLLGEYVEEIDQNKLNVGFWSGVVEITEVKLKKALFK